MKKAFEKGTNNFRLVTILVMALLVLAIFTNGSAIQPGQIRLIAYLFPELGVMALGMMLAMISGGIDLTVVAVADLTGILGCMLLKALMPSDANILLQTLVFLFTVAVTLFIGAICGAFSGLLIAKVGIPAMVATLGASDIYLGLAVGLTKGSSISGIPPILNNVVSYQILGIIPLTTVIFALCASFVSFMLTKTASGYKIYMIGSNKTAARYSGLDVDRITMTTYALSGCFAAVSGLLMCGHFNSARSDFGKSYLMPTILICVLAGVNPNGGAGKVSGLVLSVIILQTLSSGFAMFPNISDYYKNLIWGLVLIAVMAANIFSSRKHNQAS